MGHSELLGNINGETSFYSKYSKNEINETQTFSPRPKKKKAEALTRFGFPLPVAPI
jgi:hypothetical protein